MFVIMALTFAPCTTNTPVLHLYSVFPTVFLFIDEDMKAESNSEDHNETQAQTRDQLQPASQPESSSGGSQVSGCVRLRKPEQPDLADRSSQSSFTSQDGTGKHES